MRSQKNSRMLRMLAASLAVLMMLVCCVGCAGEADQPPTVPAEAEKDSAKDAPSENEAQTASAGVLAKFRFYLGSAEHEIINDQSELIEAVAALQREAGEAAATRELEITVCFASDYFGTEEYQRFAQSRGDNQSTEDVRAWREQLNAFSKQYHRGIVEENLPHLSALSYHAAIPVDYSPYVVLRIYTDKLDAAALYACASVESVVGIYIGKEAQPEPSDA